ncbi:MAG: hypothetical protein OK452_07535 [Thaumarchaeota archaeon]|nr:hypothetical protein [Nitrososphaerota archaeon]
MGGLRSSDERSDASAKGEYLEEWLKLRNRLPHLFVTRGEIVEKKDDPKPFTRTFSMTEGYSAVLTNEGIKPKFNPNPPNIQIDSRKIFKKCLVEDCQRPTGNMWGLCAGANHVHEIVERKRVGGSYQRVTERAPLEKLDHFADWIGVLQGPSAGQKITAPDHAGTTEVLMSWIGEDEQKGGLIDDFVHDVLHNVVVGVVKDSTTMQLEYEAGIDAPGEVISSIERVVERRLGDLNVRVDWPREVEGVFRGVPVKLVATVLALGFAAEEANRGDYWYFKKVIGAPEKSHYASAYMSSVYYWLRRVGATPAQARMSLKA